MISEKIRDQLRMDLVADYSAQSARIYKKHPVVAALVWREIIRLLPDPVFLGIIQEIKLENQHRHREAMSHV